MGRWNGPAIAGAIGVVLLLSIRPGLAWGPRGHRTVALIADRELQQSDPAARARIHALLATDKSGRVSGTDIASEATWADALRETSREARTATTPWHYARLQPGKTELAAACFGRKPLPVGYPASRGPRDNCVVDKIKQFETELRDPQTSRREKLAALQFLLNLVGEVNDPLDVIDYGDRGGECTALQIGTRAPVRLSTYWEERLVHEVVGPDPARGAARIAAAIPAAAAQRWAEGTPDSWAREAHEVARAVTYSFAGEKPAGKHAFPARKGRDGGCASVPLYKVGLDYETKALAAVNTQLAKGGVRLARVLRDSFK